MEKLELCGYSTESGRFLLVRHSNDSNNNNIFCLSSTILQKLQRDFVDLQSLDRLLRCTPTSYSQRLPTKRLRKLTEADWIRGDQSSGWRVELQKNVVLCENWINGAFTQLSTQQQREFLDEELYAAVKRKRAAAHADSRHARDLQQYLSSPELVNFVVKRVLEHLGDQEVVWLEPSCGDGRFLTTLLEAGAQYVVGYEIDEKLQNVAERSVELAVTNVAKTTGTIPSESQKVQAQVHLGDFLVSRSCIPADKFVVAVGNPPFGARGTDGSDLVHFFFQHAAKEWRARVIAFIVPERCSRPTFVQTTLQLLHSVHSDNAKVSSWKQITELPLTDYHFEFRTGDSLKRVRQPSVLQLFGRDH